MKTLLIATAAFALIGAAAQAQPAYDDGQGAAPSDYPACSKPGQDRCLQVKMHGGHHHHAAKKHAEKAAKDDAH